MKTPSLLAQPERRTVGFSYLLWALGLIGVCGIHRFYNRKPISGTLWLLTLGLCGLGQLVDLLLIPALTEQANQPLLLQEALAAADSSSLPPLDRQLLLLARRAGRKGFTINDALLGVQLPRDSGRQAVRDEIEQLLLAQLLDVGNDEEGRVIYREP